MINNRKLGIFLILLYPFTTAQAGCDGDACGFLKIKEANSCIVLVNTNTEQVIDVRPIHPLMDYVWSVPPESEVLAIIEGGVCLNEWPRVDMRVSFQVQAEPSL